MKRSADSRQCSGDTRWAGALLTVCLSGSLLVGSAAFGLEARYVGSLDEGPLAPTSLVVGEAGIAALEPYTGQLELFTPGGVLTAKVKINSDARGLARLDDQVYLFCDRDRSRIVRVDLAEGALADWLGESLGQAFEPVDVIVKNSECFILDAGRRRVLVCDQTGNIIDEVGLPVPADQPVDQPTGWLGDLAWDANREIFYVFDQTASSVLAYGRGGNYLGAFSSFGNQDGQVTRGGEIICDAAGWIYVTDRYQGRVVVFDESWDFAGNVDPRSLGAPPLAVPTGLAIDAAGFLYVASTEGSAIQVYFLDKTSSVGELTASPMSPAAGDSLSVNHLSFTAAIKAPASMASSVVVDFRIVDLSDTTSVLAEIAGLPLVDGTIIGDLVIGTVLWEPEVELEPGDGFAWQARTRAAEATGPWMSLRPFVVTALPARFHLEQNFPNPFNPRTTISFDLKGGADAALSIYDIRGRLVWNRDLSGLGAGSHKVVWEGSDDSGAQVSSGVYFYRLSEGNSNTARKMILMK